MAKIKKHTFDCWYALCPWGPGWAVCIYDRVEKKDHTLPLKTCNQKGCEHYKEMPEAICAKLKKQEEQKYEHTKLYT